MTTQARPGAPNLVTGYPRSPNEMLGPFVLLPRILDKCRAVLAGTHGDYKFNCPLDKRFFEFFKVDAEAFKAEVAAGKTDEEMLAWVEAHLNEHATLEAIRTWAYQERWRRPTEAMIPHFEAMREELAPNNHRVETWFQLLDADEGRF
ncbi:MAG: DUF5069 domain-containing protein [Candidatus Melainabacteria bacterium]